MGKILITGSAGFIGMHTCIRFLKEGYDVVGLDNLNNYYNPNLKKLRLEEIKKSITNNSSWKFYKVDISKKESFKIINDDDIDFIIHLAAQAGVRYSLINPQAYINSNILGFQNVINFCLKKKIKKFFYASSSSVYGLTKKQPFTEDFICNNPESYYASTKISNELMAHSFFKTHDIHTAGLRFFTVYGPWGRPDMATLLFPMAAFNKKEIDVFNYGEQSRDFTYIDDIVEAIYRLYKNKNKVYGAEIYNIGQGSPVKLLDFISIIEKKMNYSFNKNLVKPQKGDVKMTFASTKKIEKIIGYFNKTELNDGIENLINWFNFFKNKEYLVYVPKTKN